MALLVPSLGASDIKFQDISNEKDWKAAFELAKSQGKLVFVDIYTDWCTYCHKLDKEVYTDDRVADYFNDNFINLKFDAETEFGYPLTERYNVSGYPKLLFLTPNQKVFHEIDGFIPADILSQYGQELSENWNELPELLSQYDKGILNKDDQLKLIGILERTDFEKAQKLASQFISELTPEDYEDIEILWMVSRFQNQLTSAPFIYITSNKEKIIGLHGASEYEDYMKAVYNDNLNLAIKYDDTKLLQQLVSELLPEFLSEREIAEAAYITKKMFHGRRGNPDEYKLEVQTFLNNHITSEQRPSFLFQHAMEVIETFDDKKMYGFAAELLHEAIGLKEKNFEAISLLGYVNGLQGDYKEALNLLDQARSIAVSDDEKEMVSDLAEAINLMKNN